MPRRQILPKTSEILTPAINKLVELQPVALRHMGRGGRWGLVVKSWGGQVRIMRSHLAGLVKERWLSQAEGQALINLARSDEFGAPLETALTRARGEILLAREKVTTGSSPAAAMTRGAIVRGTRFRVLEQPARLPPVQGGMLQVVNTVPVGNTADAGVTTTPITGGYRHRQVVRVEVEATSEGVDPNIAVFDLAEDRFSAGTGNGITAVPVDPVFDVFTGFAVFAAGGSGGLPETAIRQAASVGYLGRYASTDSALVMGAICAGQGVVRAAVVDDPDLGFSRLLLADESWASNPAWVAKVMRHLQGDNPDGIEWIGFGADVVGQPVINRLVSIEATVMLRDTSIVEKIPELGPRIEDALRSYFDEKHDFWHWTRFELGAQIAAASPADIQAVPDLPVVRDAVFGVTVPEPPAVPATTTAAVHYWLDGATLQYVLPNGRAVG